MISAAALAARRKNIALGRAVQAKMPRSPLQLKTLSANGHRTIAHARAIAASKPLTQKQLDALAMGRRAKRTSLQAAAGRKSLAKARTYQRWVWTKIERTFYAQHLKPLCLGSKLAIFDHQKIGVFLKKGAKVPRTLHGYRDFIIPKLKLVVEVDGCYWHGCRICYPAHNQHNRARDRRIDRDVRGLGWRILRIPEHRMRKKNFALQLPV